VNTIDKIQSEYRSELAENQSIWLKIRFTPGMEMLAQEMSTGRRIFEQDLADRPASPASPARVGVEPLDPLEASPSFSPRVSPSSPSPASPSPMSPSPASHPFTTRRRSQRWMLDATGSFPTLFIEEKLVSFYATLAEMQQAIKDRGPEGRNKVIINIAHVISVEKVITRQSFAQSIAYPDVANGVSGNGDQQPPFQHVPLTILEPTEIPAITSVDQELMFRVHVQGGQPPYRYSMINAPKDLYVTEDGWMRGFIEEDQWPVTGYREFLVLVLVEDSSIPVQTVGLEFRYRLYPHA
jgi:hypothetical protein